MTTERQKEKVAKALEKFADAGCSGKCQKCQLNIKLGEDTVCDLLLEINNALMKG